MDAHMHVSGAIRVGGTPGPGTFRWCWQITGLSDKMSWNHHTNSHSDAHKKLERYRSPRWRCLAPGKNPINPIGTQRYPIQWDAMKIIPERKSLMKTHPNPIDPYETSWERIFTRSNSNETPQRSGKTIQREIGTLSIAVVDLVVSSNSKRSRRPLRRTRWDTWFPLPSVRLSPLKFVCVPHSTEIPETDGFFFLHLGNRGPP